MLGAGPSPPRARSSRDARPALAGWQLSTGTEAQRAGWEGLVTPLPPTPPPLPCPGEMPVAAALPRARGRGQV